MILKSMKENLTEKKEVLTYATAWMNLENIMLSEISQSQILNNSTYMRYLE